MRCSKVLEAQSGMALAEHAAPLGVTEVPIGRCQWRPTL